VTKDLYRWRRLSSQKWEDSWTERLRFLDPERVVFLTWPGSRALKIEVYTDRRTASKLAAAFGGQATKVVAGAPLHSEQKPRPALAIRGKLKIFSDEEAWEAWRASGQNPPGLLIPAGLAFGTGEHATTATCLRLLADLVPDLPPKFQVLDLGCGSGILALGAAALGAGPVIATDYDPAAVRVARENSRRNGFRNLKVRREDVLKMEPSPTYDLVMANLFSEILIKAAPRIARAAKPGGWLIFSGVLRTQVDEVIVALEKVGFSSPKVVPRGKWCAGQLTRSPALSRPPKNGKSRLF